MERTAGSTGMRGLDHEWLLVQTMRGGDEAAFLELVERHQAMLRRLAGLYAPETAAEGLSHEVWGKLLASLDRLEQEPSVRVTLYLLLLDAARQQQPPGGRALPFAAHPDPRTDLDALTLRGLQFQDAGPWIGHWAGPVSDWQQLPDGRLAAEDAHIQASEAIAALPPAQREVLTLRDVEGWSAAEVCAALGIPAITQRALLHRARTAVRAALDEHVAG